MLTVVERELELALVLSPDRSVPVPSRLVYRTDDPYAVHVVFHTGSDDPVPWSFSRELLLEGVRRPSGRGDVRVWPSAVGGRGTVCLALSAPDGNALLEAPFAPVSAWLDSTLRVVPPGREAELLGVDEALARLLEPAARDARSPEAGHGPRSGPGPRERPADDGN